MKAKLLGKIYNIWIDGVFQLLAGGQHTDRRDFILEGVISDPVSVITRNEVTKQSIYVVYRTR
jgi:hypothetical protein